MEPPLRGLRVLDLSRLLPGPFCTLILSDLGARVDKVEDPHVGDYLRIFPPTKNGLSGRFNALNRDKRSLCLDLKRPDGRAALLRLVEHYDVVVESFRPGVMDRLGVGYAELAARNPRVVMCSISGYGQSGPYRERAGHDLNYVALAGVLAMAGPTGGAPVVPGVQLADIAGGALWGAVGILAALLAAKESGRGRQVDVSMCEGALAFLIPDLGNLDANGLCPTRSAELLNGGAACYGVYRTSDGRYLSVAPLEPKFWAAFNAAIGRPCDLSELVGPRAVQERVRGEIQAILGTRSRDEWEAVFAGADACVEPVLAADELARHPQHAARGLFFSVGDLTQVRTPFGGPDGHTGPPGLGEHGGQILGEAGFSDEEIGLLRAGKVTR
ncbi:MAG: CoA transferase [Myxococcales bacterium]|nr:CoA transferase [Myxococcales bacterium]